MGFGRQVWDQLRVIYTGLSWPRRIAAGAALVLCVALLAGLVFYGIQPDYRLLYSGLAQEDAGAVTAKLQSRGVPFRLGPGGSSILVPADQVAQLRLDLAVEGLPSKAKGFELFDEVNITATPFDQHVKYDRALQAELARTIAQIDPIVSARVHLVRPNQTPFVVEQKPATASVVLKLRPGSTLGRKTAAGITALVSRSVEGLLPDQVTLLDTNGTLLSAPKDGELAGPAASQFEHQREYEGYLSSRAEEMLRKVLGPGRAVVRVTAEMNFRHQKTKRESYDPDQKVLAKETVTSRKAKNASGRPGGVAGTASNTPPKGGVVPAAATSPNNSEDEDNTTDQQYAVSKIEQEFEESGSPVKRLTIAAVVDLSAPEGDAGQALTMDKVQEIIQKATGYLKGRDEITVNDRKLAGAPQPEPAEPVALDTDRWGWYMILARNISLAGIVIVGLTFAVIYARRGSVGKNAGGSAPTAAGPADAATRFLDLAQQNPEAIARLLAAWIDESPATIVASAA